MRTCRSASAGGCARRNQPGFSLVELLVVVAIVAILAAVAFPAYQGHVMKSRRAAAQGELNDVASRLEQFYLDNKRYTQAFDDTGINRPAATDDGSYALAVAAPTGGCPIDRCYAVTATPQGPQANDTCGTLTLRASGEAEPAGCW